MEAVAKWNYVRVSPRKARLVADLVRGMGADEAAEVLLRTNKRAAGLILKVLRSAVANAYDLGLEVDEMYVSKIYVNEGPRLKRMRASARGRAAPYKHRMAHIVVEVAEIDYADEEGVA